MTCFLGCKFKISSGVSFFKAIHVTTKKNNFFFDLRQNPRLAAPIKVKNTLIYIKCSALGLLLAVVSLFLFFIKILFLHTFLLTICLSKQVWSKRFYKNSLSYDLSELTKKFLFYQKSTILVLSLAEVSIFLFLYNYFLFAYH